MIRLTFPAALVILLASVSGGFSQNAAISDSHLLAAIRVAVNVPTGPVTQNDLLKLTTLTATNQNIASASGLTAARNLSSLFLGYNPITQFVVSDGLTNLNLLDLRYCQLSSFTLSAMATSLTNLNLDDNELTSLFFSSTLTNLTALNLGDNVLQDYSSLANLKNLVHLDLHDNLASNLPSLTGLTNLAYLDLSGNRVSDLTFLTGVSSLKTLILRANRATDFVFPAGLSGLTNLYLNGNQITHLILPPGMTNLTYIEIGNNQLISLSLPEGSNGLTNFLPTLQNSGTQIYVYPEVPTLKAGSTNVGGLFQLNLSAPPGNYQIWRSTNLAQWEAIGSVTNQFGAASFTDASTRAASRGFYRASSP